MKKILSATILTVLLISFSIPISTIAAEEKIPNCCKLSRTVTLEGATYDKGKTVGYEVDDLKCNLTNLDRDYTTKKWGLICLLSSVKVITDWVFDFLMVFVGIIVILGAFNIVTSAGSPEKTKSGRNYILYAAIGMLVGLLAKAIPALLESLLGRE